MIQKILIAIDGSESADKALDFALDQAEKYSVTELAIVNVFSRVTELGMISYPSVAAEYAPSTMETYYNELKTLHEKILEEAVTKAKNKKPNLNITTTLVEGRPAGKIVEVAKIGKFDMLILGHRGLSGIREFVLGSVSHRVSHDAECTVIIVK